MIVIDDSIMGFSPDAFVLLLACINTIPLLVMCIWLIVRYPLPPDKD